MKDIDLKLNAPWQEVKEKLKEVNAGLTDEDLQYEPGKESELINRLSGILKRDPEYVKALIESVASTRTIAS
jgi:hypothetical protein